jgi:hypothetical protein
MFNISGPLCHRYGTGNAASRPRASNWAYHSSSDGCLLEHTFSFESETKEAKDHTIPEENSCAGKQVVLISCEQMGLPCMSRLSLVRRTANAIFLARSSLCFFELPELLNFEIV